MPLWTLKWSPICFRFQPQIPSRNSCTWWSIGVYLEDKRYGQEVACRIVSRLSSCICPSRSSYGKNNNNVATYWKLYCNFIAVLWIGIDARTKKNLSWNAESYVQVFIWGPLLIPSTLLSGKNVRLFPYLKQTGCFESLLFLISR